jgi:hypothetical protein
MARGPPEKTEENGIGCTGSLGSRSTAAVSSTYMDIVVILKSITSQWQVLDVMLSEPFIDHHRHSFSEWHLRWTVIWKPARRRVKNPSVTLLCLWIITAWQHTQPEVIVKGHKKCCMSYAVWRYNVFRIRLNKLGMVAVTVLLVSLAFKVWL